MSNKDKEKDKEGKPLLSFSSLAEQADANATPAVDVNLAVSALPYHYYIYLSYCNICERALAWRAERALPRAMSFFRILASRDLPALFPEDLRGDGEIFISLIHIIIIF